MRQSRFALETKERNQNDHIDFHDHTFNRFTWTLLESTRNRLRAACINPRLKAGCLNLRGSLVFFFKSFRLSLCHFAPTGTSTLVLRCSGRQRHCGTGTSHCEIRADWLWAAKEHIHTLATSGVECFSFVSQWSIISRRGCGLENQQILVLGHCESKKNSQPSNTMKWQDS